MIGVPVAVGGAKLRRRPIRGVSADVGGDRPSSWNENQN